jgi:hypothetical protein
MPSTNVRLEAPGCSFVWAKVPTLAFKSDEGGGPPWSGSPYGILHLLAEIQDEELAVAERLLKISLRAAGALAGVVLEGHLQRVAKNHAVPISKRDPTIADLNDPLKAAGVYDIPTWRRVQRLADLRNLCDHKRSREPLDSEVKDLIAGVTAIVHSAPLPMMKPVKSAQWSLTGIRSSWPRSFNRNEPL